MQWSPSRRRSQTHRLAPLLLDGYSTSNGRRWIHVAEDAALEFALLARVACVRPCRPLVGNLDGQRTFVLVLGCDTFSTTLLSVGSCPRTARLQRPLLRAISNGAGREHAKWFPRGLAADLPERPTGRRARRSLAPGLPRRDRPCRIVRSVTGTGGRFEVRATASYRAVIERDVHPGFAARVQHAPAHRIFANHSNEVVAAAGRGPASAKTARP